MWIQVLCNDDTCAAARLHLLAKRYATLHCHMGSLTQTPGPYGKHAMQANLV